MSNWQPATRQQWHRLAIIAVALSMIGVGSLALAHSAAAQTDVSVDSLEVADLNRTVNGDVTDARLSATLEYSADVPDAERATIRLEAGPRGGTTDMIAYDTVQVTDGEVSGTVTLEGSLTEHPALSAADFDPAVAATEAVDLRINASIEVSRENGQAVSSSAVDTATVTLTDGTNLTASVGGNGQIRVETETTE